MSTRQYLRKASLIVGGDNGDGIDLSELRFRFTITRGDTQTPNKAVVRVYNISDATAGKIQNMKPTPEFTRVVIQAGYEGNYGVIFDGTITQIMRGRESETDTYLDIIGADGDRAYNFAVSSFTLPAGSTAQDAVSRMIQDMAPKGVTLGYLPTLDNRPSIRGEVFYGMTRDEMRNLAENQGCAWSIQDGKLTMIPLTAYIPGEVPEVNSETGLIGLPVQTQNGINLKTLLNPSLKIGQKIHLNNASIQRYQYSLDNGKDVQAGNYASATYNKTNSDGFYYVMRAEHSGDTRGEEWYSSLICLAIDATVAPEFKASPPLGGEYIKETATAIRKFG